MKNLQRMPSGQPQRLWILRALPYAVGVLAIAIISIVGAYYFDVATESDAFCGLLCHPNRPQYETHEISPHAHVECGTCHIGPGLWPKVTAKIYGVGELVSLITNSYERPIEPPVARLRPAKEICEQCHWPDKGFAEELLVLDHFAGDEANTQTRTQLLLRLGGGKDKARAQPPGIHWHVRNPVFYVPVGPEALTIPWVATVGPNGELVQYISKDVRLSAEELAALPRREMDCLDCHNRATHRFEKPERRLDEALAAGLIDASLPFVKREGLRLLSASYPTQETGREAMNELIEFYRTNYPNIYANKQAAITQAVSELQTIYSETTFPSMNVTWEAYPDNSQHTDFAGCFRCHDDKHVNAQGEAIPANCTLCHSVPVVTAGGQEPPADRLATLLAPIEQKPASHLQPSFMRDHAFLANASCVECHGDIEFGTDNTSFCANGACHGKQWPELSPFADFQHPVKLEYAHGEAACSDCHAQVETPRISVCADCHQPPSRPHFGPECQDCHTPLGWKASANSWLVNATFVPHAASADLICRDCHAPGKALAIPASHAPIPDGTCTQCHPQGFVRQAPSIPHLIEDRERCLVCHDRDRLAPAPPDHDGWPNEFCLLCHELG